MKKILSLILLTLITVNLFSQWDWGLNFENPWYIDRISYDTITNPNCIWQVGEPNKTIFTSAYSIPNAILTDTLNPVPPNDTSIFILHHERDNFQPFHVFILRFWYNMDGDPTDFGKIEISPNDGLDWINVLTEDEVYDMSWGGPKPTLEGSSDGWQYFSLDLTTWASAWGSYPIAMTADTIRFRFTYITDSSSVEHDGWMIDDFFLEDWWEGIEDIQHDIEISVLPNPAYNFIKISTVEYSILEISFYKQTGQKALSINSPDKTIDISNLKPGLYFAKIKTSEGSVMKKIIVQ